MDHIATIVAEAALQKEGQWTFSAKRHVRGHGVLFAETEVFSKGTFLQSDLLPQNWHLISRAGEE